MFIILIILFLTILVLILATYKAIKAEKELQEKINETELLVNETTKSKDKLIKTLLERKTDEELTKENLAVHEENKELRYENEELRDVLRHIKDIANTQQYRSVENLQNKIKSELDVLGKLI